MSEKTGFACLLAAMMFFAIVGVFCGGLGVEAPSPWETFASFTALFALFRAILGGNGKEGR